MRKTWVLSLGWEDPLEKAKATHSSILAWRIPWIVAPQVFLSMGFPRQEYWSELPFPTPGDLPDPRIEPVSPALQADSYLIYVSVNIHLNLSEICIDNCFHTLYSHFFSPKISPFSPHNCLPPCTPAFLLGAWDFGPCQAGDAYVMISQ